MSHHQNGNNQQPPRPGQQPPRPTFHDPYSQYRYQQNGAYQGQHQYPGQQSYDQYPAGGGPVQQPTAHGGYQSDYSSPTHVSSGSYSGQQQYQYNPQDFAQSPQQPQYNTQAYGNQNPAPYPQQYNPAAFPEPPTHSVASGPVDPYQYSPGVQSAAAFSPQQTAFMPSPSIPQYSPQHQWNPQPPTRQYGSQSQRTPPPPQHGHPPPLPSRPAQQNEASFRANSFRPHAQSLSSPQAPRHNSYGNSAGMNEEWRPSPPAYQIDPRQSPSALHQTYSHGSLPSPSGSNSGPTPPAHGPSRSNTLDRHPTLRPLPGPPGPDVEPDYFQHPDNGRSHLTEEEAEALSQEDLYQQVESAVMNAGRPESRQNRSSISVNRTSYDVVGDFASRYGSTSPVMTRNGAVANGDEQRQYSDDSDSEAAQGLAMMRMEDEDDARRQSQGESSRMRFSSYGPRQDARRYGQQLQETSDNDDYGAVDMSTIGGGLDVQMTYSGDPNALAAVGDANGVDGRSPPVSSHHSSMRRSHPSRSSQGSRGQYDYGADTMHPLWPINPSARVDNGGTGGLSEPNLGARRQSYDEGDEYALTEGQIPERFPDEPPDIFFRPNSSSYRPLPPPPEDDTVPRLQTDLKMPPYPTTAEGLVGMPQQGQWVPRSTSLVSHTTTPQVVQPLRSKTDAEERRLRQQQMRSSTYSAFDTPASTTPAVPLDLPALPSKRFVPSQLGAPAFRKCVEPWSLMAILDWLLVVAAPEQVTELKEAEVKEALVALFTNKVPTMNIADAEVLSNRVVQDMYDAGTLVVYEEWVRLVPGEMQGVMFQLTGSGCYAPTVHNHIVPGRCYAHHCQRTLKKVNLQTQPIRTSESWAEFYHLSKEDCESKGKTEVERQNVLHEIVQTEDVFMVQLDILRTLYRDRLSQVEPSIISPKRKEKFLREVFGRMDAVKQANEEHLLPQLKYRQHEQGPWVVGFSDIFRQWIRKAKSAYIEYAGGFPGATFLVRQEIDRNMQFRDFIEKARNDKRSNRLGWDTYLKVPITRLQRYTLLLNTVLKNMKEDSTERANLATACDEIKEVTKECDARVAEMQRKVDLSDLSMKLVLRPGMQSAVELGLDQFGRELIYRGDLQRMGGNRFTWLDCHALLFDHYLVLAKTVARRAEQGGRLETYDVSRLPIPISLLILESANESPVQKSTYVKGITSVRDVAGRTTVPTDGTGLGRTPTTQSPGQGSLQHTNTGMSAQSGTTLGDSKDADRIMFPFKVKHLGLDSYTLFAPTESARKDWCSKIVEAKAKHARALHNQNAEPFKLRVMADSAFVYDAFGAPASRSVLTEGTPVDRAIKEVEQKFKSSGRPGPICRARVNCATSFSTPYPGKQMVAVGTDFGVFISEADNPRGWTKAISMTRVTQITVLEEFSLFLLIADKSLSAYHLDVVCPSDRTNTTTPSSTDSTRRAPQKLSGSKDVGFFVTGRMKDRTLVFYKKREQLASVFKVLEPIYQKSTEKKRAIFKRGSTDFFREFDEFYIPAECTGVDLFHSSLAVSTARGFEVLTLDKKQPWSVPELKAPHVQNIATVIKDVRPLTMLRLSEQEFLLVYAHCAVYVNKHGDVSRSVIMEFVCTAASAALHGAYLVLFDADFVEIRNAQNGRLKQVIAGREIKCLDDGGNVGGFEGGVGSGSAGANGAVNGGGKGGVVGGRSVKFVMQHPVSEKTQVVMELLLNEKMKE